MANTALAELLDDCIVPILKNFWTIVLYRFQRTFGRLYCADFKELLDDCIVPILKNFGR